MNLQNYLLRIGHTGPVAPTLDVLTSIAYRHPTSIPFENLNPLLGLPVDISPDALEEKLVKTRRGGYCFEQNSLLRNALLEIGFEVIALNARVLYMRPDDTLPPRSHMLLKVHLNGTAYLVDSGFGGATPTAPLEMTDSIVQHTPHEDYRLLRTDNEWLVEVKKNGVWEAMYQFDLQPHLPQDYTFANYYHSHCPTSFFTMNLMAALAVDGGRYTLNNNQVSFHAVNAAPERRLLESPDELVLVLEQQFKIDTSGLPGLEAAFSRFFTSEAV